MGICPCGCCASEANRAYCLRIHRERIAAEAVAERDAFRERLAFRKAIGPEFTRRITEGYMLDTGEIATREVTA